MWQGLRACLSGKNSSASTGALQTQLRKQCKLWTSQVWPHSGLCQTDCSKIRLAALSLPRQSQEAVAARASLAWSLFKRRGSGESAPAHSIFSTGCKPHRLQGLNRVRWGRENVIISPHGRFFIQALHLFDKSKMDSGNLPPSMMWRKSPS